MREEGEGWVEGEAPGVGCPKSRMASIPRDHISLVKTRGLSPLVIKGGLNYGLRVECGVVVGAGLSTKSQICLIL